jgi:hypothetical protein
LRLRLATMWLVVLACASAGSVQRSDTRSRPALPMKAEQMHVAAAILDAVIASLPSDTTPVCIALGGPPPPYWYGQNAALLRAIDRGGRRIVGPDECPPTYETSVVLVDTLGRSLNPVRPPGYVDPYKLNVRDEAIVAGDSVVVMPAVSQGTSNTYYRCVAHRASGAEWVAKCRVTGRSISALPPNGSLQLTSARSKEAIGVSAYRYANASEQVSRILRRSLAVELQR